MRRALTWFFVVPLALLGSEAAHAVGFWFAAPNASDRAHLLASTGHAGESFAPVVIGFCGLLVLLALVGRAVEARRAPVMRRLSFVPFALLPLLAFALRELIERASEQGGLPLGVFAEPVFICGLVLQLPFAVIAFLAGRGLLSAAERLGQALVGDPEAPLLESLSMCLVPAKPDVTRLSPLAFAVSGRGPPSRR